MSGARSRQPLEAIAARPVAQPGLRAPLSLAAAYLGLLVCVDCCLTYGIVEQRYVLLGRDLMCLGCLVLQTAFLTLLVRRDIASPLVATLAFSANFLLINAVIAQYAAAHVSHYAYATALLGGEWAFLAIWLILGPQPLGWRMLGSVAVGGLLVVGWYGYAARRSTIDWNLIWITEALGVAVAAAILRAAGFRIRLDRAGAASSAVASSAATEGEGQFRLWHLMAGLFVASCLLGLARLLGVIKPTYFADLFASEIAAADLQRGVGVGLAASLAVAFAAHAVLLRTYVAARYLPALVYAFAMGYAIHFFGPPYVLPYLARSAWSANPRGYLPTDSQWSLWMLLSAGIAMSGSLFLHALGYRLVRSRSHQSSAGSAI
jgi:hypothetical protein